MNNLNQICNINREDLSRFLINDGQNEIGEATQQFCDMVEDINTIEDVGKLYRLFKHEFKKDENKQYKQFERTVEEIIKSRVYTGCNDVGLVLSTILRMKGIPTVFVSSGRIDWIEESQSRPKTNIILGHVFLEIFLSDKWYLFDSIKGLIYDKYNYNNLSLPRDFYAYRKTLNNWEFGAYTVNDNNKIMRDVFKDFDISEYKDPEYEVVSLKEYTAKDKGVINE
ncbi:MAG: transglutaminase domain-containing protein [Bacilli bacterium]|nr:transglutaminase domain-containing protein [Bacilli bacterium]